MRREKTLKISSALHKRLKVYALLQARRMDELAEEILDQGLTKLYANLPTSAKRTVEALGGILDKEAAAARRTKKKP